MPSKSIVAVHKCLSRAFLFNAKVTVIIYNIIQIYLNKNTNFCGLNDELMEVCWSEDCILKVIYHLLYSINNFVTNKSKLPQDGAQVFPYMG